MAKKQYVVLAGCGGMSRAWLNVAQQMDDVEIVGLVDIAPENARKHAEQFNLDVVIGRNLKTVLKQTNPDIVFDCTIPEAHTQVAVTALNHGCHVLSEKPMADSMANARRALRTAQKTGKTYAIIQNRRYNPNIRRLTRLLARGAIGPLTTVHCDFFIGAHFGGFRDHMEHVLLLDMAIHTFDAARLLTGADPVSVYCREWNPAGSWYDHDASAVALFEMTGGIVYTYRGSWCAEGRSTSWESDWRFVGTKGSATWDGGENVVVEKVAKAGGFITEKVPVDVPPLSKRDRVGGHEGLIREFIHCVQRGRIPETVCTNNIKSLAMVFGAIDSAQKKRPVAIKA
jgi:predicted dehydrogenase